MSNFRFRLFLSLQELNKNTNKVNSTMTQPESSYAGRSRGRDKQLAWHPHFRVSARTYSSVKVSTPRGCADRNQARSGALGVPVSWVFYLRYIDKLVSEAKDIGYYDIILVPSPFPRMKNQSYLIFGLRFLVFSSIISPRPSPPPHR